VHAPNVQTSGNAKSGRNVQQSGGQVTAHANAAGRNPVAPPAVAPRVRLPNVQKQPSPGHQGSPVVKQQPRVAAIRSEAPNEMANGEAIDRTWKKLEAKANPYYATLHDPFNVGGVRIPDSVNYPSATFSIIKRVTLTASSSGGVAALAIGWFVATGMTQNGGFLVPVNFSPDENAPFYIIGQKSYAAGASLTDIFGIGATGYPIASQALTLEQWREGTLTVPGLFNQVRLVSAGVAVNSTAAVTDLSGVWRCAFAPPGYYKNRDATVNAMSFDEIGALPGSVEAPVNTGKGVTVTYNPLDLSSLNYCQINGLDNGSIDVEHADLGTLFVAGAGLGAGSSVIATIVLNYEGIPASNTMGFIQTTPSIDDPLMIASALNRREDEPQAFGGTAEATRTEHATHPLHLDHDGEKVAHLPTTLRSVRRKGSGSKVLVTDESEQVGFLETLFKSVIPLVEGGVRAVEKAI